MSLHDLPAVNAGLNAAATVLLTAGYVCIRRKRVAAHRAAMLAAVVVSAAFLATYLTYHLQAAPTRFAGTGFLRPVYFAMLISHILLAMAIVPLVPITVTLALRGRFERHRAWARWTFPIWYYVSVTGVLVYFFLYRWWPAAR